MPPYSEEGQPAKTRERRRAKTLYHAALFGTDSFWRIEDVLFPGTKTLGHREDSGIEGGRSFQTTRLYLHHLTTGKRRVHGTEGSQLLIQGGKLADLGKGAAPATEEKRRMVGRILLNSR